MKNSSDQSPLLEELEDLDEQLIKIRKFLSSTKTGNLNDSLFTPENILSFIQVLESVEPRDKYMINALKALLPLAEKSNAELEQLFQKRDLAFKTPMATENYNACTPKLRSKIAFNKII